jgi:SAM-dependent methyltransferase
VSSYYESALSGIRLKQCYELATKRVRQYLAAEVDFVLGHVRHTDRVLELGCGYGRVLAELAGKALEAVGIDNCADNIRTAREFLSCGARCELAVMDAAHLGFRGRQFDLIVCIQNTIGVLEVDRAVVVREGLRVARAGGRLLLSSYSDRFWDDRLEWFQIQVNHGLIGAIDRNATGDGTIVSCDGFRAGRLTPEGFASLAASCGVEAEIVEVDGSSVFCEITVQ